MLSILKKMFKMLEKKKICFQKNKKIIALEEMFSHLGLWMVNFSLCPYTSYLSYFHLYRSRSGSVLGIRIRFLIHKVPE